MPGNLASLGGCRKDREKSTATGAKDADKKKNVRGAIGRKSVRIHRKDGLKLRANLFPPFPSSIAMQSFDSTESKNPRHRRWLGFIGSALIWDLKPARASRTCWWRITWERTISGATSCRLRFHDYLEADDLLKTGGGRTTPALAEIELVFHLGACFGDHGKGCCLFGTEQF